MRRHLDELWRRVEEALGAAPVPGNPAATVPGDPAAPVVWLLGKTGAGKTSIVAALTGDPAAEIGPGYRPATRTSRFYDVPEGAPALRFLDTRGLGEAGYDPAEDIAFCEGAAHALVCVAAVDDTQQADVLAALAAIRRRHPDWPVIVAQTTLHRLYPHGADHPHPYPYRGDAADLRHRDVPAALAAALGAQREAFAEAGRGAAPVFVPVDLTKPEDGFTPADFGADALAAALEGAGVAVAGQLRAAAQEAPLRRKARLVILGAAASAGMGGAFPAPGVATGAVATALATMLRGLAAVHGVQLTLPMFRAIIGAVAGGGALYWVGLRFLAGEIAKVVPGAGTAAGMAINGTGAAALAYGLGEAAHLYLGHVRRGQTPPDETVRAAFRDALKDGLRRARQRRAG